jgi:hypothetical protein
VTAAHRPEMRAAAMDEFLEQPVLTTLDQVVGEDPPR